MSAHRGETDMHWLFHFLDQSFAHTIAESKFGLRPKTSQTEKPFFFRLDLPIGQRLLSFIKSCQNVVFIAIRFFMSQTLKSLLLVWEK